jgi:peptidoglycan-N-acetylglucosamine deacetylase
MDKVTVRRELKSLIPERLVTHTLAAPAGARVLLTFDDGPNRAVTPRVLERLDRYGARGVFFVVGHQVERSPELVPLIVSHGHLVGNHTYQHRNDRDPWFLEYLQDLRRCQTIVAEHGPVPRLFRPPRGHLSFTTLAASQLLGLRMIHWSLNVRDWTCHSHEDAIAAAEALERQVVAGQIIDLHDGNPFILDLLDHALPRLKDRGFDLASAVDEL